MSRQELVSLDVLGSEDQLQAAAAREDRSAGSPDSEAEGRDAYRAVIVCVDRRGRVSDVLISTWWPDELTPSGLQDALLSAYQAALGQATARIAPRASDSTSFIDVPATPGGDDDEDDYGWLSSVRRRLDRSEEMLVSSGERLARSQGTERLISGPGGLVRLVLTGPVVSGVLIDAATAMQESSNRLAADALAAFQSID